MKSDENPLRTSFFDLACTSEQEAEDIAKLLSKYRQAMNACFVEELGHKCTMTDGEIVRECLIDGLRVTRKAITIFRKSGVRNR
jgi:hypothetical protein